MTAARQARREFSGSLQDGAGAAGRVCNRDHTQPGGLWYNEVLRTLSSSAEPVDFCAVVALTLLLPLALAHRS